MWAVEGGEMKFSGFADVGNISMKVFFSGHTTGS